MVCYSRCALFAYIIVHNHLIKQETVKVVLGTERKQKETGAKKRVAEVEECMVYVPIPRTLEFLCQNDLVTDEVWSFNIILPYSGVYAVLTYLGGQRSSM